MMHVHRAEHGDFGGRVFERVGADLARVLNEFVDEQYCVSIELSFIAPLPMKRRARARHSLCNAYCVVLFSCVGPIGSGCALLFLAQSRRVPLSVARRALLPPIPLPAASRSACVHPSNAGPTVLSMRRCVVGIPARIRVARGLVDPDATPCVSVI
ncbi:hypothetical protein Bphy_0554 [Paraburkholderia phymatum STM815]|uniref:Uncharacterized protein n=1 Tax=Paraburkholderia phymatum (strain DSM 17167 / CIP 108236 / LMG 21445 / STM815) TaxID=391038 RepID=B2JDX0_PARP8|nr:hypothetical protein Bphy_0554 [Paraburkholderia phymatum STM815]